MPDTTPFIAVIIPAYKVKKTIAGVIDGIGPEASAIIVVDDACPEGSGAFARESHSNKRLHILTHESNQGVGGAVISGYKKALELSADIAVKLDGDGQMDGRLIAKICAPIISGQADYTKGNRFFSLAGLKPMPGLRLFGNTGLSFLSKLVSGYWKNMDPTNGFTAIDTRILAHLPLDKIDKRYFFENDMLFRLSTLRAMVVDVPMASHYENHNSSLSVRKSLFSFSFKALNRFIKRIFYNYFLRDFNVASLALILGLMLSLFGASVGISAWATSIQSGIPATSGTVMLSALPLFTGVQLLLTFINYDVSNQPGEPISQYL